MTGAHGNYRPWIDDAACLNNDPGLWCDTDGTDTRQTALETCQQCPVRLDCLRASLTESPRDVDTIRGGTLPSHRNRFRTPERMIEAADRHVQRLQNRTKQPPAPPVPSPPPTVDPAGADEVVFHYAHVYGIDPSAIRDRGRTRPVIEARRAIAVCLRDGGMSLPAIGRVLNRHHTTVIHHLRAAAA